MMFFVFKQKTADERRSSDWSSDVCSSDLQGREIVAELARHHAGQPWMGLRRRSQLGVIKTIVQPPDLRHDGRQRIGIFPTIRIEFVRFLRPERLRVGKEV